MLQPDGKTPPSINESPHSKEELRSLSSKVLRVNLLFDKLLEVYFEEIQIPNGETRWKEKIDINLIFKISWKGRFDNLDIAYKEAKACGDTKSVEHICKKIRYWTKRYAPDVCH